MSGIDVEAFEDEWEEGHKPVARRGKELSAARRARIEDLEVARVIGLDRGRVTVLIDDEVVEARLAGTMRGHKAAVGDRVRVQGAPDTARIVEVLDRDTELTRTPDDNLEEERVVVANADQIVVILAADNLDAGVRFLDRVLVAASVGRLDPVVCLNRVDLVEDREPVEAVATSYEAIGIPVQITSAHTGEGVDQLARAIAGTWSAFAGHSGVGKSSLFNQLIPDADQTVGEIGSRGGRHTTVAAWAMPVPALDAWIVDTPGVRSFGLGRLRPDELARHFPELAALHCHLDDCTHRGEPGCALSESAITPQRWAAYERLWESMTNT